MPLCSRSTAKILSATRLHYKNSERCSTLHSPRKIRAPLHSPLSLTPNFCYDSHLIYERKVKTPVNSNFHSKKSPIFRKSTISAKYCIILRLIAREIFERCSALAHCLKIRAALRSSPTPKVVSAALLITRGMGSGAQSRAQLWKSFISDEFYRI